MNIYVFIYLKREIYISIFKFTQPTLLSRIHEFTF